MEIKIRKTTIVLTMILLIVIIISVFGICIFYKKNIDLNKEIDELKNKGIKNQEINTCEKYIPSIFSANKKFDKNLENSIMSNGNLFNISTEDGYNLYVNWIVKSDDYDYYIENLGGTTKINIDEITSFTSKDRIIDIVENCIGGNDIEQSDVIVFLTEDGYVEYSTYEYFVENAKIEKKIEDLDHIIKFQKCSLGKEENEYETILAYDNKGNIYDLADYIKIE